MSGITATGLADHSCWCASQHKLRPLATVVEGSRPERLAQSRKQSTLGRQTYLTTLQCVFLLAPYRASWRVSLRPAYLKSGFAEAPERSRFEVFSPTQSAQHTTF